MIKQQLSETAIITNNPYLDLLRKVTIFSHLEQRVLVDLFRRMSVRRWYSGSIIVGQNEPGGAIYVVAKGKAKVVLFGESGREMTLSVLGPTDFFGEMSLFDGKPRSANVVALEDVVLLVLSDEAFLAHLESQPRTALSLLTVLTHRLRKANETINNLALHDVSSRLTRTLLAIAEESGEMREEGILIRKRPTQQELANMVGTCRETVSRTISAMSRDGLVVSHGRSLLLSRTLLESQQEAA